MSVRQCVVNLHPGDGVPVVRLNQYDLGVTLAFVVKDQDTIPTFPSGTTCTLQATRPSGTGYSLPCTLTGNIATIDSTIEMTREYGDSVCELRFVQGTDDVGTGNFILGVERAAFANDTIDENTNHWNALAQQVHADTVQASADAAIASDSKEAAVESAQTASRNATVAITAARSALEASNGAMTAYNQVRQIADNWAVDKTLTVSDQPADAKETGDRIADLRQDMLDMITLTDHCLTIGGGGT